MVGINKETYSFPKWIQVYNYTIAFAPNAIHEIIVTKLLALQIHLNSLNSYALDNQFVKLQEFHLPYLATCLPDHNIFPSA